MDKYEHRKARKKLVITGADGKPASAKQVSVKLKDHKFLFGWGAFDVLEYTSAETEEKKERFSSRAKQWEALFNYGTLPFYWGLYEPSEGDVRKDRMMKCVDRMVNDGAKVKGHPLCWHTVCADWLLKYSDEEIMQRQLDRITREVSAFKGKVELWDVINETVIMPDFDRYDNAVTRLCRHYGRIPLMTLKKCIGRELIGCDKCKKGDGIFRFKDRKGVTFTGMRACSHGSVIFNSVPTYVGDDKAASSLTDVHFIFTTESRSEVDGVISAYAEGRSLGVPVRRIK